MRKDVEVRLGPDDRERLEAVLADRNSAQKHAWRARIILATDAGCGTAEIRRQAALNWLVDNFPGLADCLSSVKRVASLLMALDEGVSRGEPDAAAEASVEEVGCELPS